ncbi:Phosphotransferase enzyme family protein [Sphingobium faniae]|nr:Phosphotransferase enzyme family protein [Sphingobium faniae]
MADIMVDQRDAAHHGGGVTYPTNIAGLTSQWMKKTLESANPGLCIDTVTPGRIIWGTATKAFFTITYNQDGGPIQSANICIKGAFCEKMRTYYDVSILYITEAAFYRDIAPQLNIVLPRCWLAIEDRVEGIVILDDLGATGVTFGQAFDTWTPDETKMILTSLAQLHATTWGWKAGSLPWLTLGSGGQRTGLSAMIDGDRYATLTSRPQVLPFIPAALSERNVIQAALAELWRQDDVSPDLTVSHGDAHLGQTYIMPDGQRGLLDWQSVAIMPWAKDVAYFLGGALAPSDRRACERDLLDYYRQELHAAGGPMIDGFDAWKEYRKQMLMGIVWPCVIEDMQPIAAIETMSERYLTAMTDLDTLGAIRN